MFDKEKITYMSKELIPKNAQIQSKFIELVRSILKINVVNENSLSKLNEAKPDAEVQNSEFKIEKGFSKLSIENYLSDNQLLISKKGTLKGFKSLNIKGYRLYELDEKGNITTEYFGISNNYSVYTYDKKNRLIKSENKQHNPPEVYNSAEYKYSDKDSVIEIIRTSYEDNAPTDIEVVNDSIWLDSKGLEKAYFQNEKSDDFYINTKRGEIITYKDKMIFCCGVIMKGRNKLTYYFNENERFDSLIIEGIESGTRKKFEYEYREVETSK